VGTGHGCRRRTVHRADPTKRPKKTGRPTALAGAGSLRHGTRAARPCLPPRRGPPCASDATHRPQGP
jgi:hypothetical protein